MKDIELGQPVRATAWLKRVRRNGGQKLWERTEGFRYGPEHRGEDGRWTQTAVDCRDGIFIGYRTLSNGRNVGGYAWDDPTIYTPSEHFQAALVVFGPRENPVYVPLDALKVIERREGL